MDAAGNTMPISVVNGWISGTFDFYALTDDGNADTMKVSVVDSVISGMLGFLAVNDVGETIHVTVMAGIVSQG